MTSFARLIALALLGACATEPPESWSYVYSAIVSTQCTTSACHSELSHAGNLDLHDRRAAYHALTGRDCADQASPLGGYVDTEAPANSELLMRLRREGPTGMPPNRRLAESEIARVEAWMLAGASCD